MKIVKTCITLSILAISSHSYAEKISILVEGGSPAYKSIEAMKDNFTKETGHEIEMIAVPYIGLYDKLISELAAQSSSFDVAAIDILWFPAIKDGLIPMDNMIGDDKKSDLFPHLINGASFDGKIYGMPIWDNSEILIYRKDLFEGSKEQAAFKEKYGYDLKPPQNWKELSDISTFFTRDMDSDGIIDLYGTAIEGKSNGDSVTNWLYLAAQAGANGHVFDQSGNIIIDTDPYIKASEELIDLYANKKVTPQAIWEIASPDAVDIFKQGRLATMFVWAHFYPGIYQKMKGKIAAAPNMGAAVPGPWYHVIFKNSDKIDAAKEFVEYMYEHNYSVADVFGVAARKSVFKTYAKKQGFEHLAALGTTLDFPQTFDRPAIEQWQEIENDVLIPTLQNILLQKGAIKDNLQKAKEDIEFIIE